MKTSKSNKAMSFLKALDILIEGFKSGEIQSRKLEMSQFFRSLEDIDHCYEITGATWKYRKAVAVAFHEPFSALYNEQLKAYVVSDSHMRYNGFVDGAGNLIFRKTPKTTKPRKTEAKPSVPASVTRMDENSDVYSIEQVWQIVKDLAPKTTAKQFQAVVADNTPRCERPVIYGEPDGVSLLDAIQAQGKRKGTKVAKKGDKKTSSKKTTKKSPKETAKVEELTDLQQLWLKYHSTDTSTVKANKTRKPKAHKLNGIAK